MTTVDLAIAPVLEELGNQIELLDRLGGRYVRDCLAHALGERPRCPHTPPGMHHIIGKALREMAKDEAIAVRLYGPGRRVSPGRRQPDRNELIP